MAANSLQVAGQPSAQKRRGNPNWRPGVSANPSGRGKRLPAMVAKIVADHGGEDRLTAASLLLIEQACRLKIKAERAKEPNDAVRLANASARLLGKIERRSGLSAPSRKYRAPYPIESADHD